ncbi:hypothetical protein AAX06_06040 [Moraxella bovoculi]|uniref:Uncharacterized protein n=1 Tax=Moraxella bovoculi TaxID=386891 RepID=A0AAC8T8D3_9GAMM|nr:hypothetical protein [Moraxella bovoculi]AKG07788.1 hypothetical protein AAX06_06040 [Moraxella bovoculi]
MLEIIGGISLTIFLIVLTSNLPILGFIITFIMAFFFPWLWILVGIYTVIFLLAILKIRKEGF